MDTKKNLVYLFLVEILLLLTDLTCRVLTIFNVVTPKVGDNILLWSVFLLLIPIIMVLSRFTMFSRLFYISIFSMMFYCVALVMKKVLPEQETMINVLTGVLGIVLPCTILNGIAKMLKDVMGQKIYGRVRSFRVVVGIISTLACGAVVLVVLFKRKASYDVENMVSSIYVSLYLLWIVVLLHMAGYARRIGASSLYKTMDIVEFTSLNEDIILKTKVTEAITKNFLSCAAIRIKEDDYRIVHADPYIRGLLEKYDSAREGLEATITSFSEPTFYQKMRTFLDLDTVAERVKGKHMISVDFVGANMGKCRASMLPLVVNAEGEVTEVLYTVQHISKELLTLQEQLLLEETLIQCISIITTGKDFEKDINRLLEIVGTFYKADRSYIFEADYENNKLINTHEWCSEGAKSLIGELQNQELGDWLQWFKEFKTKGVVVIRNRQMDLEDGSFYEKLLHQQDVESLLAVPITDSTGMVTGFIGVDNPAERMDSDILMRSITAFVDAEIREERYKKDLYEMSHRDMMTGFYNRNSYNERIEKLNCEKSTNIGVFFIDVNGLKKTNDTKRGMKRVMHCY